MISAEESHERDRFSKKLAATMLLTRENNHLSKNKLSEICGISRTAIRMIENGDRQPAAATLFSMARGMKIPLWKIIKQVEEATNRVSK